MRYEVHAEEDHIIVTDCCNYHFDCSTKEPFYEACDCREFRFVRLRTVIHITDWKKRKGLFIDYS